MRSRFYIEDLPPVGAESYGNLKFHPYEENGVLYCKAWRGKQGRPYAHFRFRDEQRRSDWIAREKHGEDETAKFRENRAQSNQEHLAKMLEQIQVGTILTGSWGYDQTNVEIYGVVERRGHYVWLRKVSCKVENEGWRQDKLTPKPGQYYGETIKRLITPYGVKLSECCSLTPDDPTRAHHATSYA